MNSLSTDYYSFNVGYLFNVCYFFYQRVYVDEYESEEPPAKFPRSNSFPNLRDLTIGGYVDIPHIPHPRRRANSEVVPVVSHNNLI